jgi:hypothetical protein
MQRFVALLAVLAAFFSVPAHASDACSVLAARVARLPAGPGFLTSYPTAPAGPLQNTAFLYGNALSVIALAGCGDVKAGARIGDAILVALDHDRYWHDGRLRNSYAGGHADKPVKLAGWWDKTQNRWVEDQYQVGSDTGNMAWAMLALLVLDKAGAGSRYRDGALRMAKWVDMQFDTRAPEGYMGGTFGDQPQPTVNRWKATEHNTDLAAAFTLLGAATGDAHWRRRADTASAFVLAMWNPACGCFESGTTEDGSTRNTTLALDAQLWPLLAIPAARGHADTVLKTATERMGLRGGFAYGGARGGLWTEGTEQGALTMKLLGQAKEAQALSAAAEKNRAPDGGYFAADTTMSTGFDLQTDVKQRRVYYRIPALAPLAWAALAEQGFNPFTGTRALPR